MGLGAPAVGFVWQGSTYPLQFTDGRAAGLEVHCSAGTVGQLEAIAALDDEAESNPDRAMAHITEVFAKSLVSWNLERPVDPRNPSTGTEPVPATLDGLKSQDHEFVQLVVGAWVEAQLARKRERDAGARDREVTSALAEFDHELI